MRSVPFFSNTADNTHCFQAALLMILKSFLPEQEFSWEELDAITGKKKDLWTWPFAASIWMKLRGFEVVNIDPFDNKRFAAEGERYLFEVFGEEVAKIQIAHSDIEQEQKYAKLFVEQIVVQQRTPSMEDIQTLLDQGYLLICNINSRILARKEGYVGHSVVVTAVSKETITFHNPGLPGEENVQVSADIFEKAWASPNEEAKNILGFRLC